MARPVPPGKNKPKAKAGVPGLSSKPLPAPAKPSPYAHIFQDKARKRLAELRLADHGSLPGVKPSAHGNFSKKERYAILAASRKQKANPPAKPTKPAKPYDPLASIGGKDFDKEVEANTKLRFGSEEQALRNSLTQQDSQTQIVGSGYDQYRQALEDAKTRIAANNEKASTDSQGRVDSAYQQDKASQDARDKTASDKAAQLGLSVGASTEGAQAVEGARSQGNQSVANVRGQGSADNTLMEKRGATSVQAKTEALSREGAKRKELTDKQGELAGEKGAFRVSERGKLRDSERQWSAVQKEFNLKTEAQRSKEKDAASDRSVERMKSSTQKIVAKLYADANQAKARATIRVAKLQLEKGKIDQKQYREITNIYKGLPKKGTSPQPKNSAGGGSAGLQTWETDKVNKAVGSLNKANPTSGERGKFLKKMTDGGLPLRLARIAWDKYVKSASNYNKGNQPG